MKEIFQEITLLNKVKNDKNWNFGIQNWWNHKMNSSIKTKNQFCPRNFWKLSSHQLNKLTWIYTSSILFTKYIICFDLLKTNFCLGIKIYKKAKKNIKKKITIGSLIWFCFGSDNFLGKICNIPIWILITDSDS